MAELVDVLANNLRAERSRRRLTQAQVAEMIGLGPGTLSEIERGIRPISVSELTRVCRVLGVPLIKLLEGGDPDDLAALGL